MTDFTPGQRWLSESETELGLGLIKEVDYRLVTVLYPAVEEERTYAKNNAPLSRITFDEGDTLTTGDGLELVVQSAEDHNGLMVYHAHPAGEPDNVQPVPESLLGIFGTPTPLMTLLIRADKPLARVASTTVLEKIREQGFYLQMPPAKENLLKEIGVTPPETHY